MSIVADQRPPDVRAGLAEKAKRWEDEDDARGPEPEAGYTESRRQELGLFGGGR